jgi:polyhydroxyalkanoate synthesis regulator phasin
MATPEDEIRDSDTPDAETSSSTLTDIIERTLLVGIGAAALTKDRVQAVVDDLVRRGQLTRDEGREVVDDLSNRSRDEVRSARQRVDSSLQTAYREIGLVARKELEDLDFRLRQVEHRLELLERKAESEPPSYEDTP